MFGINSAKYINAATDISDGFYGDLIKILNNNFGASITKKNIPVSRNIKNIIKDNNLIISMNKLLTWGDDYELILIINKKYRNKIKSLAKINKVKLSMVGSIIKEKGIFDDSMNLIKKLSSFDHFC